MIARSFKGLRIVEPGHCAVVASLISGLIPPLPRSSELGSRGVALREFFQFYIAVGKFQHLLRERKLVCSRGFRCNIITKSESLKPDV